MTGLSALWLPILLSSVIVFVASFVIHMALPWWHQSDYTKVPNEDRLRDALRPLAVLAGVARVPPRGEHHDQVDDRRIGLRAPHRGHVRLAVAALARRPGLSRWWRPAIAAPVQPPREQRQERQSSRKQE